MRDDQEIYTREFFYPIDYEYQGGSFQNNDSKLKALLRHQICKYKNDKSACSFKIELTTVFKQSMVVGYLECKLDAESKSLSLCRFYIYKLYRKLGYTEKALNSWIRKLFSSFPKINKIKINLFESNRLLNIGLNNMGFKLSIISCAYYYSKISSMRIQRRYSINVHYKESLFD